MIASTDIYQPITNSQQPITISLIECPRDAMQGWPHMIPTAQKISYINSLLRVGFHTIDFGSFVSPKAIPQMADTKEVLAGLDTGYAATKLLAIVANRRGAEDAVVYDQIHYLGFPFSISPTFQLRNTNSTLEESLNTIDAIQELCIKNKKELVLYLSMAFGNPYGDAYDAEILSYWAGEMVKKEISIISLADTVGLASASQISFTLNTLLPLHTETIFGVHLHATAQNRYKKIEAAWQAGCRRFDGALKGIGGCPMAQTGLVGNMATEEMISFFTEKEIALHLNTNAIQESIQMADSIFV